MAASSVKLPPSAAKSCLDKPQPVLSESQDVFLSTPCLQPAQNLASTVPDGDASARSLDSDSTNRLTGFLEAITSYDNYKEANLEAIPNQGLYALSSAHSKSGAEVTAQDVKSATTPPAEGSKASAKSPPPPPPHPPTLTLQSSPPARPLSLSRPLPLPLCNTSAHLLL